MLENHRAAIEKYELVLKYLDDDGEVMEGPQEEQQKKDDKENPKPEKKK